MSTGAIPEETIAGRYRLEALLGRGGMGDVYKATDLETATVVALKVMRQSSEETDSGAARFIREAKKTATLDHPNIVRALDFGRAPPGILYLVVEHLDGESLSKLLKREVRLSPERSVRIATQLCAALGAVHAAAIVHRDVKPANAMRLVTPGNPDFIKLIDFGIARGEHEETRFTETGMLAGTTDYAAPEQILGQPLDGRTDQYALGVMLYRMLSGVLPFEGAAAAMVHQHLEVAPVPLTHRVPDAGIPPALDVVVLRCLAKQASARHASMDELAEALRRSLEARPDALTVLAPVALPHLDQIVDLELDVPAPAIAGTDHTSFRRCARCGADSSRFATHCLRCGTDLGTPDQLAFMAGVIASARAAAPAESPDLVETRSMAFARPSARPGPQPGAAEPLATVDRRTGVGKLLAPLAAISTQVWMRVCGYSLLALGVGWFFGLFGSTGVGVLCAGAAIGAIGLLAHGLQNE